MRKRITSAIPFIITIIHLTIVIVSIKYNLYCERNRSLNKLYYILGDYIIFSVWPSIVSIVLTRLLCKNKYNIINYTVNCIYIAMYILIFIFIKSQV